MPTVARAESPTVAVDPGRRGRLGLAVFMLGAGLMHFVVPESYEKIVPRWLGSRRRVVFASGAAELLCGTLLLSHRTAKAGAWLTAALFVAVFPANVQMLLDAGTPHQAADMPAERFRAVAVARLPLQLPLIAWAVRVARRA